MRHGQQNKQPFDKSDEAIYCKDNTFIWLLRQQILMLATIYVRCIHFQSQFFQMEIQLPSLKQYLHNSKSSQPAAKYSNHILETFDFFFQSGEISISEEQKPFNIAKVQPSQKQITEQRLQRIHEKKAAIRKQMDEIHEEQQKIMGLKLTQSKVTQQKYFKSKMTPEDLQRLRTLYKAKQKFQADLHHKTEVYEENIKKMDIKEKRNLEEEKQKQLRKKKQDLQRTIQMMDKRREEQKNLQSQENKKLKSLLQEKKLYEQMQRKWKQVQENEEKKKLEMKEEMKRIRRVDFEQIKEHEKKYEEAMRQQRESRVKNAPSFQMGESRSNYKSKFIDSVKEEDAKNKEYEELKKTKIRELSEKRKYYGEQVRTVHKPKKFLKMDNKENDSKITEFEGRSLSLFQTHERGNSYMREVNNKIAEHIKDHPESVVKREEPKAFKYTNYLAEIKASHSANSQRKGKFHEITKLMRNQNISQDEKLFKARLLAQKIENNRGDRQSDASLLTSINAKLAILKQLE